uniref:Zinc finger protein 337 n=2 Tax=Cacopsylla melanoneura TaxID=428564 RepID=A0A8D8Q4A1_9HEMI
MAKHCKTCPKLDRPEHLQPFVCLKCKYTTDRQYNMISHLRTHIGKAFTCSTCSKRFTTELGLNKHIKKSHRGYLFTCVLCSCKERSLADLYDHYSTMHRVDLPSKRCKCGEEFKRTDVFEKHLSKEHADMKTNNMKTRTITLKLY